MTTALLILLSILLIGALVALWMEHRQRIAWQIQCWKSASYQAGLRASKTAPSPESDENRPCCDVFHNGEWYGFTPLDPSQPIVEAVIDGCMEIWGSGRLVRHEHGFRWISDEDEG